MIPTAELNNGVLMPRIGLGVYRIPDDEVTEAALAAFRAGYRSVDTATLYGNERGVGAAVRKSDLAREDVFVTTKLWNTDHGRDAALRAFDTSLAELGLDQVDLYLIHWPVPEKDRYVETWRALTEIAADGRARAVGVSNFDAEQLQRLVDETGVVPAVNQIELNPWRQQAQLRDFHARLGIATEAWRPLADGGDGLRASEVVRTVAHKHGKTPAQAVVRWHLEMGHVVIPKSTHPERMSENLDVFDFEFDAQDVAGFATLESG